MDDYQRYLIRGIKTPEDATLLIDTLEEAGYYQCECDLPNSFLYIPIAFSDMVDDIEELILNLGFELDDSQ